VLHKQLEIGQELSWSFEKMCWDMLREEFRLVQFRLLYPNAKDFAQSPVSFDL